MRKILFLLLLLNFISCHSQVQNQLVQPEGKTIKERFLLPPPFIRVQDTSTKYDDFLRNLSLLPHNSKVYLYNGKLKNRQDVYEAVIDYDIGKKDLQQCADAVIRIRAEYLYNTLQLDKIHFNFTNGVEANYVKYAEGYRYQIKTNSWEKTSGVDYTYETFRKFLDLVYTYAGSLSLSKELVPVKNSEDIKPGDVFIKGGSPGHAVTVVDVAKNPITKQTIFLLAQSYMPAQSIHILKNPNSEIISPWYNTNFGAQLVTPEWTFNKNELMRFKD